MAKKYIVVMAAVLAAITIAVYYSIELADVHIKAVGDILLDRGVRKAIDKNGYEYPYEWAAREMKAADIAVANLECPVTQAGSAVLKYDESLVFKADKANAPALKAAGFDILNLANNHTMDYERTGMIETLSIMADNKLHTVGAGLSREDARKPEYLKVKGRTIGFLSYSIFPPEGFIYDEDKADVARVDDEQISSEVSAARQYCDFLVVQFHWGIEFDNYPTDKQKQLAHKAIDSGADIVLGHHPHVLQSIELYKGKPVLYSLGNFVFDKQKQPGTDETIILDISVGKNGWSQLRLVPVRIKDCRPEKAEGEAAGRILNKLREYSADLGADIQISNGTGYIVQNTKPY